MIHAGDVIENPVTGERLIFRKTSRETNGEAVDDVRLPFPPAWMQRIGLALGAPVGRLLGYDATYVPSGEPALETSA